MGVKLFHSELAKLRGFNLFHAKENIFIFYSSLKAQPHATFVLVK